MRATIPRRNALPIRVLATIVVLWIAVFAAVSLAGSIYLEPGLSPAVQHIIAGLLALALVFLAGIGLSNIWRDRR